MIASPPVEPKDAGEYTICEYRKNKPKGYLWSFANGMLRKMILHVPNVGLPER
uniref:Uncharacterized protein n=1 Tax=viral metagenome TaxID=1070528 RepID=A0A6H2A4Q7_9ZZZZ